MKTRLNPKCLQSLIEDLQAHIAANGTNADLPEGLRQEIKDLCDADFDTVQRHFKQPDPVPAEPTEVPLSAPTTPPVREAAPPCPEGSPARALLVGLFLFALMSVLGFGGLRW